jgi:hypothetical protein
LKAQAGPPGTPNIIRAKTISPEKYHIWATGTRIIKKSAVVFYVGFVGGGAGACTSKNARKKVRFTRPAVVGG